MRNIQAWSLEFGTTGVLAPGRWLWVRAVLWATLLFAGAFAFFLAAQYLGAWLHLPPNSAYAIFLGIPIVAFVVYAITVQAAEARAPVEVLPYAGMFADILVGAAIGFVMLCAMTALLWSLGLYHVESGHWRHVFDSFVFGPYFSGMLEELMFRAILLRILARAFGPRWGLLISAVLFGVAHLGHATWLAALEITINAGLTTGLLYMVTGRLWMSIGLHTAWDFTEDSVLGVNKHNGLLFSTPMSGKSDLLTGGVFGPEASGLATIVGILTVIAIVFAWKRGLFPHGRIDCAALVHPGFR
jgi:membrane protease YdiL (CAAX protease family)